MDHIHKRMLARLPKSAGRWYDIRNAAGPTATVRIYSEIGFFGITADDFATEIEAITAPDIEVQINSPGGQVFDSVAIYNALRTHPAKVTTRVDGIAASGASVIVQAGDRRVMLSASQMMLHRAWGLAIGSSEEMREMADLLDRQTEVIAGIYANRAGRDVAEILDLLNGGDTWLTDAGAVEAGLADEVFDPDQADDPDGDGPESRADQQINAEAVTEQRVRELLDEALASFPLAGEREEPTTGQVVDPGQADRLLSTITLSKE